MSSEVMMPTAAEMRTAMTEFTTAAVGELLDALAELRGEIATERAAIEASVEAVLTDEQRASIKTIRQAGEARLQPMRAAESEAESTVRAAVLGLDKSVKGTRLRASLVNGSDKWDTAALKGYAVAHPEIKQFVTPGVKTVRISEIAQKDGDA